ncbi:signal peptide, CUB and EGF-like domain-containing protein 1 [Physella acuta]|uniref:signal peptide, CUB and EGF-like domain-containing protein 1 n=1 Tax=Physella acuta TaxID=109671 RepID=UPI0027DD22D7|nr:signal peptide, CUB and EGF-like domain-containing protein 1 [Physella acuta]
MPIGNLENFKYGESTFTCNDGESFVYSTMSCAGCGPGFTYNNSTKKCDTCPQGTYQDQDISFTCTKCPDGTTTRKNMSTSITDCQDLCLPGSVSNTGFQNCTPCPVGKFASQYGMKECQLCPYGMSTMTPGASSIQICLFTDFRINENTSRPAIQISDAVPKKFTFMAWISEVSSFQTSTFIFSIQSPSDNSAALVLDTISLHIERNADVTLRKLRKWNHVALVYTSPNVTLLVNGQHVETLNVLPVSELHTKDIFFRSSSSIKSILVSGMQMTRTTYTESQIKAFSSSCSRQVDKHELAYKPWEILVTSQITCNDKDLCTDEPCGPYGVCVSGTDTLTCICDDPWKGDRCEIAPDYCVGHHCAKGSTCLNQPHDKGYSCLCPNFYKGALCNEPHFHGGFGAWEEWSGCSSSCGGGVSTRRRSCDNPFPAHGGNMCNETLAEETKQCNTQECPVCKLPDLREGQTKWNCSTDEAGLQTCNIVCSPGLVLMPTTYNIFQCGPVTNYTWSQQTPDNPVGLTPSCSDQKTPESISSVITTTFDVDCSQESLTLGIRNHVHEQLTRDECFSKNNCFHTVDTHSSCRTSRKRSIGTMVLNVSLNSVGNDTDSAYFGGLKEEDIAAQRMKVLSFEKVVEDIFTKNETIFTATVDGVTYRGQIQSVEARFICQPGSGFVGGMCVDCPAGTYSPGNGSCLYCEKGFYQDKANSAVCKKCPTGTTTSGRGSYSLNHCTTNPLTYLDVYPYQFYPSPNKETPNKQHPNHKDDGVSTTIVIAAVTSSVTFLLMLGVVVFILIKKYGQSISKTAPEGYIDLHVSSVEGTK